ncbi:MAG: hypothetical protein WC378_08815 [Opitutaceae bacterium]|jgi:hypothetical protein
MNSQHRHTEAANFLVNHALPSEAEIDAMSAAELAKFLSENGIDVPKLNSEIPKIQAQLTGKLTLANARQARLTKSDSTPEIDISHLSQDQIIEALKRKYGCLEEIPLAARNFKSFKKEDWESLYKDLIGRGNGSKGR